MKTKITNDFATGKITAKQAWVELQKIGEGILADWILLTNE